jgi:hypothetical protein
MAAGPEVDANNEGRRGGLKERCVLAAATALRDSSGDIINTE